MTAATASVIKFLQGELTAAKAEDQDEVVNGTCKPMIRSLVGQYDAEDERRRLEAAAQAADQAAQEAAQAAKEKSESEAADYDASFMALSATFARFDIMHGLAAKHLIHRHYWMIFIPVQIIVTLAALLAFFAAALDSQKKNNVAFWLSLAAGALGFVAALLNAIDRYLDWRTKGELHKKAASVYDRARSSLVFNSVATRTHDGKSADRLHLSEYEKKLANLNDSIGELRIPYQITQAFECVDAMIHNQVMALNVLMLKKFGAWPFWPGRVENDFCIAAYAVVANEITNYSGLRCCCTAWPCALPDPKSVATKAHKKITEELFDVHFRDVPGVMEALRINYDQVLNAAPAPTPAAPAADPEAPADAASRERNSRVSPA